MIKNSDKYLLKVESVSIDADYKPPHENAMQNTGLTMSSIFIKKGTTLSIDCDTQRIIRYFQHHER